ncbi:hypothetical protein F2Q69_00042030 [Brassica cretica]|uniref:Uncharacterized protein n=2 Tax=Brassica TaxID=3705 RepID=A0A8S9NPU1_BRACR|nr:hypothetical protein F2Q69_00042030 [Brassica cretica]CAF1740957.1 unnamed protein product [Brassica napus]
MGGAVKDIASKSELDNFRHSGAPIALHFWACGVMLRSSWIKSSLTSLPIYLRHDTLLLYTTLCLYEHDDLISFTKPSSETRI